MAVLNAGEVPSVKEDDDCSAVSLSRDLQRLMMKMKAEHMTHNGRSVDYKGLRDSEVFAEYQRKTTLLKTTDIDLLEPNEKLAFFINVYNSLGVHGLAVHDKPLNSVLEVEGFWRKTSYIINGHLFSLDDIEHGVLRGNRPHPATGHVCFKSGDPRCKFSVDEVDPRVHFALVCGAKSCPPIQVYSPANLEHGLLAAARNFCEQEIDINIEEKMVTLSKIFQWYGSDFGENPEEILRKCLTYLSEEKQQLAKQLLDNTTDLNVMYKEYDWSLNMK